MSSTNLVETTRNYYDSHDADEFYFNIWGGEDIHVGLYQSADEEIFTASSRTVEKMATMLKGLNPATRILDIGSGYGGAARYLASRYGCKVTCLNLSDKENDRNREKNRVARLDHLITVVSGNFEEMPFEDASFDTVWSEDAILHSGDKPKVFAEVKRVAATGAQFIFTDPMQSDNCPDNVLDPILQRIHLKELGSVKRYRQLASENGLKEEAILEMPEQLVNHYSAVLRELDSRNEELRKVCSPAYIDNMKKGLQHWINGGKNGYLNWGILIFSKQPAA